MKHDDHDPGSSRADAGVDATLREWRRRQDAAVDADALAARVVAAIRSDTAVAAPPVERPSQRRWLERTAWFATGIAAAVLVSLVLRSPTREDQADWPPSARFAPGQIAEKAALVAGMEDTFGAGLAWVAEHDRRVAVGLVVDAPPSRGVTLAVRIVVLARGAGDSVWTPVWQSDVVTRDEQVVDVAAGPGGAGRLRLWTHPLPDGAIAVDGELSLVAANPPVAASYSGVQRPGEPRRVTGEHRDGIEWQVIQTVVPLGAAPAVRKEVS